MIPRTAILSSPRSKTSPPNLEPRARTDPHLVFVIDSQPYACPVSQLGRLMRLADAPVKPSPAGAPAWEAGRLFITDEPEGVPIICLRQLWGLPPLSDQADHSHQCIIMVRHESAHYALLADASLSVISGLPPESSRFLLSQSLKGTRGTAFHSATPWGESLLVVVEMGKLLCAVHTISPPGPNAFSPLP